MPPLQCPTCQAVLPRKEIEAGWCESCGKKLPAYALGDRPEVRMGRGEPRPPAPPARRSALIRFIDALPLWLTLLVGLGLAGWGAGEFRVALGTSADAAEVDLVALEKGGEPPQNHLRVGPHVSLYPGAIYGYDERNKGRADPPVDFVIYPIVSKDNPYFTLLRDRIAAGDDPDGVADMRFPPTDRLRMLVLTRKYRMASEIPTRIESRGAVTGLLVNSVRGLEKQESDLLRQSYPDLDPAKTLILEEDRKPKFALAALLISGVGWVLVLLTAVGFFRRVFVKTAPPAQPAA